MADVTWPFATGDRDFAPEGFDEAVEFNVELTTARSGRVTTLSLPGARWRCTLQFPATTVARLVQRRQLEAFLASLRGGADRLLLWSLLTPEPLGTMRGTVTLAASVADGASAAQITGGYATPNLLPDSGFEIDTNGDGVADGWETYTNGSFSGAAWSLVSGTSGATSPTAQRVFAATLGSGGSDLVGIRRVALQPVVAGLPYSLAADFAANVATFDVELYVDWLNSGGGIISASRQSWPGPSGWNRRKLEGIVAPAGAVNAKIYVWIHQATSGSNFFAYIDNLQFEQRETASSYAGLPTLLRGDRIAFGGQRVMLTADAIANDAGAVTVSFQPAHRAGASSGAAVTLVKPTTKYVVTQPVVQMPARGTDLPGFAMELVEE